MVKKFKFTQEDLEAKILKAMGIGSEKEGPKPNVLERLKAQARLTGIRKQ